MSRMHEKDLLIKADAISVIKQGKTLIHDVSLEIKEHDFITIIGPNGAGKSTLLKSLLGFFQPNKGNIYRKENLKIGYVPQHINIEDTLPISVKRFLKMRKTSSANTFAKIVEETGISKFLDKKLHLLSGGELQKTLVARALLDEPELLVLDEPAQNLDIAGQLSFYKLLEEIYAKKQISIFMVSHDLHMVMASTKQVICLFHHICCEGSPHIVTKDPEFISLFGNDMAKMMAVYQHTHNHKHKDA